MATRKTRGKHQNIFLIECIKPTKDYVRDYVIMGSTGNVYNVKIKDYPECTCPDYVSRHRKCKHIYFVLIRVMQVNKIDEYLEDEDFYDKKTLKKMFKNIPDVANNLQIDDSKKEMYNKMKNNNNDNNNDCHSIKKDTDDLCPICLDDLENGEELDYCKYSCGKYIHKYCFAMMCKKREANCPFCRSPWIKKEVSTYINLNI